MLIQIQKKLNSVKCPSCGKTHVLEANLSCNRDDKKCQVFCQCKNCTQNLLFEVGEGIDLETVDLSAYVICCSLETRNCHLELVGSGTSSTEGEVKRKAA